MEEIKIKVEQHIKKMIDKGNQIENLLLVTSLESLKDIKDIDTAYGTVRLKYNYMLPKDSLFVITPNKLFF